jgi:hypothetical protein
MLANLRLILAVEVQAGNQSYVEAVGTDPVAPARRAFAGGKDHAAARRRWLGQRADHASGSITIDY